MFYFTQTRQPRELCSPSLPPPPRGGALTSSQRPESKKIKNWMLNILAFLWTFFLVLLQKAKMMPLSALSKSPNLVPMVPAPLASWSPGTRAGDSQSYPRLVRLRYLLELEPKLVPLVCSGFKAATFSLIISYSSGEMAGCHSGRKSLSFLISNLAAPFGASILKWMVGYGSGRMFLILPEGKGELCGKHQLEGEPAAPGKPSQETKGRHQELQGSESASEKQPTAPWSPGPCCPTGGLSLSVTWTYTGREPTGSLVPADLLPAENGYPPFTVHSFPPTAPHRHPYLPLLLPPAHPL